ncbi:Uu.00g001320.m01.CDS01 [Anthostomella pinea]|uniref:Uu.00g001320.m01.CDS01 n=1 Tax=Anthostomella pinea TaxID=933095 RepID=A0AAI8YIM7_9PEZI|nr:Uu.00g001320.m01.CDS01 [Anthostomella pinea]
MVSTAFSTPFTSPSHPQSPSSPALRRKKTMSITQTYFLAHQARGKLSTEAARPDHNLRLLVGHANLLDSLMLDLADAEREQESWFNQSVRGASPKSEEKHIQWADSIVEEQDWEADSSDSDDSDLDDDEDIEMADAVPLTRVSSISIAPPSPQVHTMEVDDEDFEEDDEEDYAALTLTRSHSHSASPPELEHDCESSDDESMPPSPPTDALPTFSEKQRESTSNTKYYDPRQDEDDDKSDFYSEGYYLPPRNPARLVSAISVY